MPPTHQNRFTYFALPGHAEAHQISAQFTNSANRQIVVSYAKLYEVLRAAVYRQKEPLVLVGYSLGGRLALHLALNEPDRVERLVLIGANPGISDSQERARRRALDESRAAELRRDGMRRFLDRWYQQPIFGSLANDPDARRELIERRSHLDSEILAGILSSASPGRVDDHWPNLHKLRMPTLYVAGALDPKYVAIGRRFAAQAPHAALEIIEGAGHAVHIERPEALADTLNDLL